MISCVKWVPRGAASAKPLKYEVTVAEMEAFKRREGMQHSDIADQKELDRHGLPKSLRMDDYGEEYDNENFENEGEDDADEAIAPSIMEAALENGYSSGEEQEDEQDDEQDDVDMDESKEEDIVDDIEEEDEEDQEDLDIKPTDKMVVVAQTDEEFSVLEVYVYDEEEGSLYVHHDISLPAFPLSLAWLGCGANIFGDRVTTDSKNYMAVGTFKPEIEIWNLDVLDALEPSVVLGTDAGTAHTDAVMALSWNELQQHLLASASADKTIKVWDLSTRQCVKTFTHHTDKVQSVVWNPVEPTVLLSGSFDRTLVVFDAQGDQNIVRIQLESDVECAIWNIHRPEQVLAATEDGYVTCFDVRNVAAGPLYRFQAHKKPCSSISISRLAIGLLATCSPDKSVRLWDLESGGIPKNVASKTMSAGALFDCSFDMNDPFMLAAGGDEGLLALWDVADESKIEQIFKNRTSLPVEPAVEVEEPKPNSAKKKKSKKKKSGK